MTSLLDILKEADLRVQFTQQFKTTASREMLDPQTIQRRLLLCLYGLGTNTGLKRICTGIDSDTYEREFGLSRGEQIVVNSNGWLLGLVTVGN